MSKSHSSQKYLPEWQTCNDSNKDQIGKWCSAEKFKPNFGYCTWCKKSISVANSGKSALLAHAKTDIHLKHRKSISGSSSLSGFVKTINSDVSQKVSKAEIQASLAIAEHNIPLTFADCYDELVKSSFEDSKIANEYHCKRTKSTYILTDGLLPCIHEETVNDLKSNKFSLLIDESNKKYGITYLNLLVKYFDEKVGKVVTRFFKSVTVGHATAVDLAKKIMDVLAEDTIPTDNLLMVMSDSPNVMRGEKGGVIKILKDKMPHLIDIGGCTLHHISNAAKYASKEFGEDIEEFIEDVFYFFRNHPAQVEDLAYHQDLLDLEKHKILRYVETRWLSLIPVADRLLEQYSALLSLFNSMKSNKSMMKQPRVQRIVKAINEPSTRLYLTFLGHGLRIFEMFEKRFQSESPLIHRLYSDLSDCFQTLMLRFLRPEVVQSVDIRKLKESNLAERGNMLSDEKLAIGQKAKDYLSKCGDAISNSAKKCFYDKVRAFYTTALIKLVKYIPLNNQTLIDLAFLDPICRKTDLIEDAGMRLAQKLSTTISPDDIDTLQDEIRQYVIEKIPIEWEEESVAGIDQVYWSQIFKTQTTAGQQKYPILKKLVFALLALGHGNAETERSFSVISDILTKHRSALSVLTLNALLTVKNELHVRRLSCTSTLPSSWQKACSIARNKYFDRLEAEHEKRQNADKPKCDGTKSKIDAFSRFVEQQREENNKMKEAIKQKKQASEAETGAIVDKRRALDMIKQGQRLLEKADNVAIKASKVKDAANDKIEKLQSRIFKSSIKKAVKRSSVLSSNGPACKTKRLC